MKRKTSDIVWTPSPSCNRSRDARLWEQAVANSRMSPGRFAAYREWLRWKGFL